MLQSTEQVKKHFQSILSLPTNFHLRPDFGGGTFDQVKREWETDELKGVCVQLLHTVPTLKCQRCGTLMDVAAAWFPGPIWARVSPRCDHSMKQLMPLMVLEVTQREMWSPPELDSVCRSFWTCYNGTVLYSFSYVILLTTLFLMLSFA